MIEPFAQRLGKAEHLRDAALHQHVEIERNAAFKLGLLEQRLHQHFGIDVARLRLDNHAHVFGRLIADVADQQQLLFVEQFGDPLDQARLLHQPRNFGDDDIPGAARTLFLVPLGANTECAAAGGVGFGNDFLRVDNNASGRKIRSLDVAQQATRLGRRLVDQMQRGVA